jgi:pimeloyl-ACP methyl ester carboxylesterase
MPDVRVNGVRLYYEITGEGTPIVFVHEFGGDFTSWKPQIRFFSRRYQTVTYNARGYPPSEVPEHLSSYGQDIATDDLAGIIKTLRLSPAHVVGLSMGAFTTLRLGLRYPEVARSLVVAGCGYGSEPEERTTFQRDAEELARRIESEGMEKIGKIYALGPTRLQFQRKDPRGYAEFVRNLLAHSAKGSANTMRAIQAARPSLYDLADDLKKMELPTLILSGDEDWPCLKPNIFLKKTIPTSAVAVFPNSGHAINLEEPLFFNTIVQNFLTQVDCGRWPRRDPKALNTSAIFSRKESA